MSQYPFDGLAGGGTALDGIPYATLTAISKAYGMYSDKFIPYIYDPTNNNTTNPESLPNVVVPNDNATGTGAWIFANTAFSAGTASLPSMSHMGDVSTGIFFPATNEIAFASGTNEAARITSLGYLGIGIAAALTQLHIASTGPSNITLERLDTSMVSGDNLGSVLFRGGESTIANVALIEAEADLGWANGTSPTRLVLSTTPAGSTTALQRLRIDSYGNVGIGTDSLESWDSTKTSLQIGGNASLMGVTTAGSGGSLRGLQNSYHDGSDYRYQDADEASMYQQTDGVHTFRGAVSGVAGAVITWIDALTIDIEGNLASVIDTDRSNIFGRVFVGYDGTNSDEVIFSHMDHAIAAGFAVRQDSSGATSINSVTGQITKIKTNNVDVAEFTPGATGITFTDYTAGSITSDAAGNLSSVSDVLHKEKIENDLTGLDAVLQLNPISYNYTKESGLDTVERYHGLSANHTENIVPGAVYSKKDEDGKTIEGSRTIYEPALINALINSVKELKAEIEILKGA